MVVAARSVWSAMLACVLVLAGFPAMAQAAAPPVSFSRSATPTYTVTLAARVCTSYNQVMANRARNDIQESLQDLGKDTVYQDGQAIDPELEADNNVGCAPLNGVRFTFGANYQKPGQYSTVTTGSPGIDATSGTTGNGVPVLDAQGSPTGATIDGATTYQLNDEQAQRASGGNQFWVQAGTPAVPLPPRPGGGSYGFAALRCAIDNLNGDNVEWIGYPAGNPGARHVFCYAYYIDTPPAQGTIIIRKELTPGSTANQTFTFASNATYNPDGRFDVAVQGGQPAQQTFVRAVSSAFGGPYTFAEDLTALGPQGWSLTSVTCDSTAATVDPVTKAVSVDLHADATVTCTWVNDPPHDPGLTVRKVTTGGVGTFPMTAQRITDPAGAPVTDSAIPLTATTITPDIPVQATGLPATVAPGQWRISEVLPTSAAGTWTVTQAYCNGRAPLTQTDDPEPTLTVDLPVNGGADCTFVNAFTPRGALTLQLVTTGGVGTAGFQVSNPTSPRLLAAGRSSGLRQSATTTTPGLPPAVAAGDPTDDLPLAAYTAISSPPLATAAGSWRFVSFTCRGAPVTNPADGTVNVALTPDHPTATCTAVYQLLPPTQLHVIKHIAGPLAARTGFVVVTVDCADGAQAQIAVPPGRIGDFPLPAPLLFQSPTSCTIAEPDTGVATGATVATTAQITDGDSSETLNLPATVSINRILPGYTVGVTNTYALPPPPATTTSTTTTTAPTSSPTPTSTAAATSTATTTLTTTPTTLTTSIAPTSTTSPLPPVVPPPAASSLANTGPDALGPLLTLATTLLLAGAAVWLAASRPTRRRTTPTRPGTK